MQSSNSKPKKILLCADDYAFDIPTGQSIRDLILKKRINATSCMSDSTSWKEESIKLKEILAKMKEGERPLIGLHFSLTEPTASKYYIKSLFSKKVTSLLELLIRSKLKLISEKRIYKILDHQFNEFIKYYGSAPEFIDGHQHVHQFPIIRRALIKFYKAKQIKTPFFIRSTFPICGSKDKTKEIIINLSGAKKFAKTLKKEHIPTNSNFSGLYQDLKEDLVNLH